MAQNCTGDPLRPSTQAPWHCSPWLHTSEHANESGLLAKSAAPASSMRRSRKRSTTCGMGVCTGHASWQRGRLQRRQRCASSMICRVMSVLSRRPGLSWQMIGDTPLSRVHILRIPAGGASHSYGLTSGSLVSLLGLRCWRRRLCSHGGRSLPAQVRACRLLAHAFWRAVLPQPRSQKTTITSPCLS